MPAEFLESMASRQSVRVSSAHPDTLLRPPRAGPGVGGPPALPLLRGPLDPTGHVCPRSNGYKR